MDEIENILLAALIYNPTFLTKTIVYFEDDLFEEQKHKVIFSKIKEFYTEFSSPPDYASIYYDSTSVPELTPELLEEIEDVLKIIKEITVPSDEWLYDRAEKFIREKKIELALVKSVEIYRGENKKLNIDAVPDILRDAISISFDSRSGMSFLKDAEERYEYYTNPEHKIPCGIKSIDDRTDGGIPTKTLNAFMGATGVGKTLSLCSLAASYSREGHNVLYISLEMKEEEINKRLDANKLDVNLHDFATIDRDKYLSAIVRLREKHHGDIMVKQFSPNTCTVNHIKKVVHDMKIYDKIKPTVIIVDYLGLMASAIYKKGGVKLHEYLKSVSEELRGLCIELDVIGWTGLQTNRDGVDSTDVGLDKIASSFDVTHGLDYVMGIWRTPEGDEEGIMFMKEEKSRYGNRLQCPVLPIGVDLYKQRLFDYTKSSVIDMKNNRKVDEIKSDTKNRLRAKFGKTKTLS